jgi:hypothetical protein
MLHGCSIEGMVVGGPAFQSRQLDRGDIIFMIDDEEVDVDSSESMQTRNVNDASSEERPTHSICMHLFKLHALVSWQMHQFRHSMASSPIKLTCPPHLPACDSLASIDRQRHTRIHSAGLGAKRRKGASTRK